MSVTMNADDTMTFTAVFKDGGNMAALIPIVMSYPDMEEVKWCREAVEETSNVYSCADEHKAALVEINEKRGRVCTYNNEAFNVEDYEVFFGYK